jgi:hypothetical protein
MDVTTGYSFALSVMFIIPPLFILFKHLLLLLSRPLYLFFLKHIYYPEFKWFNTKYYVTTRFHMILFVVLAIGNILATTLWLESVSDLLRRTGRMAIINLIPLTLGEHMNLAASRLNPRTFRHIHRCVAVVATLEGVIHSIIAFSQDYIEDSRARFYAFLVCFTTAVNTH